jgi:hypothetical protein
LKNRSNLREFVSQLTSYFRRRKQFKNKFDLNAHDSNSHHRTYERIEIFESCEESILIKICEKYFFSRDFRKKQNFDQNVGIRPKDPVFQV